MSTSSIVTVAASSATTSGQTFHIAAAAGSMAGSVIAAKLPVPANSKIVTVNVPNAQGGTAGLQHHWHVLFCKKQEDSKKIGKILAQYY